MKKINFKLEVGAELPSFDETNIGLTVKAFKILKVYKGDVELSEDNLLRVIEGFDKRGFIKLRVNERILFGTGLSAIVPEGMELQIRSVNGLSLEKGVIIASQIAGIGPNDTDEIGVVLANTTTFLPRIDKNEIIAQLVPRETIRPEILQISEDLLEERTDAILESFPPIEK